MTVAPTYMQTKSNDYKCQLDVDMSKNNKQLYKDVTKLINDPNFITGLSVCL